jgi:hypothetical protein
MPAHGRLLPIPVHAIARPRGLYPLFAPFPQMFRRAAESGPTDKMVPSHFLHSIT